jgi:dolichyl-diphosphooligosaccharide--protein glycosyltransferase
VIASFVPIPIKMNQATYEPEEHDAARWMRPYADEQGWEFPENYVLSWWGDSRMYNYFVNYHSVPSLRYSYARSNDDPFPSSASPEATYQRHRSRVGFVVTTDEHRPSVQVLNGSRAGSLSMHARLHDRLTSRGDGVPGLAHYRALWTSEDGSVRVFTLVPGARITGTAAPNTTVTVSTTVALGHRTFRYERRTTANATGTVGVTVPYPGEYTVGNRSVTVSEADVTEGRTVPL